MPAPQNGPIDHTMLEAIRQLDDGSDGLLSQVIGLYLGAAPALLCDLRRGFDGHDNELLKRAAHTLKSSSGNVGAMHLADLCRRIEAAARAGTVGPDVPRADEVDAEFGRVRAALELEAAK
jgi:HPt (histidine-containing phosphotransfer) domain-containing protein